MTLNLELDEQQTQRLQEAARVLTKNAELYKWLA